MAICSVCAKDKTNNEMLSDKSQPNGISKTCKECRDATKLLAERRRHLYSTVLHRMATYDNLNHSIKDLLRYIEKEILEDASMVCLTVVEMAHLLSVKRSGLCGKLASHNLRRVSSLFPVQRTYQPPAHGVSWNASKEKWTSRIIIQGDKISLGLHRDKETASELYRLAKANKLLYIGDKQEFVDAINRIFGEQHEPKAA